MSEVKRPTEAQIKSWKKEHNAIFQIEVNGGIVILRQPKMVDLERAMASDPKKKKPMNFNRSIVTNCKLYADPGMIEDETTFLAVCSNIDEIVEVADATVKKL